MEYDMYDPYCRRIGTLRFMTPTLVLMEHVLKFLLGYEDRLEFLAELVLAIPPELACAISPKLAPLLVLAHLLALPVFVCALYGGVPPVLAAWYCITMVAQHTPAIILRW